MNNHAVTRAGTEDGTDKKKFFKRSEDEQLVHFSSSPWILSFLFISMRGKEGKVFKTYREFCVHLQVDTFDILELRLEGGDGCLKSIKKK